LPSAMQAARLSANQRYLWTFHGGLHLPDDKELSNGTPLATASLPPLLLIPLRQHIGAASKPLVRVGQRVLKGQLIAEAQGRMSATVHASSSGRVIAIEERPVPHASGLRAPCILIETDGLDAWAELPPPLGPSPDPVALRERIRWAGIVGMGGAAFPSSVKLSPAPDQKIRTLIMNGAECEPYITCDDRLMRDRPARILQGVRLLRDLLGVEECLVAVEDNKPEAIMTLRQSLRDCGDTAGIEIIAIPTLYPSGGERQLIRILTGLEVPSHGIPAQIGILCQNIATAAAIADAAYEGKPLISRVVTLTGRALKNPRNLEVPIGSPIQGVIDQAGGFSSRPQGLLIGGPMMGFACEDLAMPVTKAVNCLLALTPDEAPDPGPALACIRCGNCAQVCPVNLLPQQMYWHARARDLDKVRDYNLFDCIECGCCAVVCPSHIPLVQYYRFAKTECLAQDQEKRQAELARQRHEAKEARLARLEEERKANLRKKKEALGEQPPTTTGVNPVAATASQEPPSLVEGAEDPKKAAIAAALKRAAEKKAALASQGLAPKNTENLGLAQQRQIEAAEARRRELTATQKAAKPEGDQP